MIAFLASPLGRRIALYGGAALLAGWMIRQWANGIAEQASRAGEAAGWNQAAKVNRAAWDAQRKLLAVEKATLAAERGTAAGEQAATARARETMARELRASLGALRADLDRVRGTAAAIPPGELDGAIRAALVELRGRR